MVAALRVADIRVHTLEWKELSRVNLVRQEHHSRAPTQEIWNWTIEPVARGTIGFSLPGQSEVIVG